jgi:hypothetical protein
MKAKRTDEAAERDNYGHDSGLTNGHWGGEAAASVRSVWGPDSATSKVRKRSSPTAACGKPHVRWCGRVPGRNPRHPTRSPSLSHWQGNWGVETKGLFGRLDIAIREWLVVRSAR